MEFLDGGRFVSSFLLFFLVIINGEPKSWSKVSRGLRQGYPSLPLLFTLVFDLLNRMIR